MPPDSFRAVLNEAMDYFQREGFSSQEALNARLARLRIAAEKEMPGERDTYERVKRELAGKYASLIERGGIRNRVQNVGVYSIANVRPQLHAELDRRIRASTELIRLNREDAVEKTLRRFSGWATSVPAGGATDAEKSEAREDIVKPTAQAKYEARRVAIDQGHKLLANLSDIVAQDAGAIAAIWHSNWRQAGYHYRPDHKERDGKVYAIRGCWAVEQGVMKRGDAGYLDEITQPGQEVFCRCTVQYVTSPRDLPDAMLTEKGRTMMKKRAAA